MNNFSPTGTATNRFTPSMFLTPQGNVNIGLAATFTNVNVVITKVA